MKIFVSWSGERSKMIAIALKAWLEKFFQTVEVFMSESDIEPGTRWASRLNDELQVSTYGIICLTPENQNSQWILFEAGALSNQVKNRVTPLLFQLREGEVKGPLSQFQYLKVDEDGFRRLAAAINKNLEKPLSSEKMSEYFNVWWKQLDQAINEISTTPKEPVPDARQDRDLIEEILQFTRNQTLKETRVIRLRGMSESQLLKMNSHDITDYIKDATSRIGEGIAPSEIVRMKEKIILAATILKQKYPEYEEAADRVMNVFPEIKKPTLLE